MRASVLFEQGKPLSVEDVELEAPRAGEVLVRIVLGDEGAGVVESLGPGVGGLAPGDHVILSWAPTCGNGRAVYS